MPYVIRSTRGTRSRDGWTTDDHRTILFYDRREAELHARAVREECGHECEVVGVSADHPGRWVVTEYGMEPDPYRPKQC